MNPCHIKRIACAVAATLAFASATSNAHNGVGTASSELSMLSALPIASVVVVGGAASVAAVAVPVALSTAGAVLVVKTVESTARGTICVLERASDGARVSVELAARGGERAALAVGRTVQVSVIGAGAVLSMAGEVVAFVPNELGRALLHNERITH